MQFGSFKDIHKYDLTGEAFAEAFAFLGRDNLAELPEGWIELGHGVRASVQHYKTSPAEELRFETHEKYFDIQYLVEGEEKIGCCTRQDLVVETPYSKADDITFYREPHCSGTVLLHTGDYVVLAPEDAHKPRCAADKPMCVKKIVVKVPVLRESL